MAKWIEFIEHSDPKKKTKTFVVKNKDNNTIVGVVKWYGAFRQYSFFSALDCVFEKNLSS